MRKNKVGGKVGIKRAVGVYTVFRIKGLNLDRFINIVKKRNITLYDVKKQSDKRLIVTVSYNDSAKFFAIAKELCYNIKKVREKGKGYPLLWLSRSVGVVLGAVVFILCAFIAGDTLFDVRYSGSGSIYSREVDAYLNKMGVVKYARFSNIDLERLEDGILSSNEHLSFASCAKRGSILNVELVLKSDKVNSLDGNVENMTAAVDGVIESIKVYRGTALLQVGDSVKKGDVIVDGYVTIKEQTVKTGFIAAVSIRVNHVLYYHAKNENESQSALLFAEAELLDKEILAQSVTCEKQGDVFLYTVTSEYRQVFYAG